MIHPSWRLIKSGYDGKTPEQIREYERKQRDNRGYYDCSFLDEWDTSAANAFSHTMTAQEAFEITKAKSAEHEPTEIVERIARAASEGATSICWNSYQDVELSEKQIGWLKTNGYKVTEEETVVHGSGGMVYNRTIYKVSWCP